MGGICRIIGINVASKDVVLGKSMRPQYLNNHHRQMLKLVCLRMAVLYEFGVDSLTTDI